VKLRQAEVFHAIMLTGTVSGAARLLNISQPAVTKTLLHAEDQIGFKLFIRKNGRISPTSEATLLFAEATKMFASLDTMRALARNLRGSKDGNAIRLAAPPAFCLDIIPKVVSAFRLEAPDTAFEVHSHHYAGAVTAVLRQDVDLALAFNPQEHPALQIQHFATGEFIACFPARDGAALPPTVGLALFKDFPFISLSGTDPIGASVKAALQLANVDIGAAMEVNTNSMALALVEQGAGAAIVDEHTAASLGNGVVLRPIDPALTFDVGMVSLASVPFSDPVKRLVQLLRSVHAARRRIGSQASR
jgi:DNA-binding transcriptional LysR family regulator